MIKGLSSRADSNLIGFIRYSISSGAITIEEVHKWVYYMIKKHDQLPPYMYYLMEVSNMADFEKTVGFPSYADLTNDESKALNGLSYVRGISKEDGEFNISKKAALNALKRNPQVIERFKETFPFIDLPE
tara:strand:- start:6 stop:395 length:390 start_codon:yes stop_codon:yes gene_type:complete